MDEQIVPGGELQQRIIGRFWSARVRELAEVSRNERASVQSVARVIAGDGALSSRLIEVARFAGGRASGISTLAAAITAFGVDPVVALALGLTAFGEAWRETNEQGAEHGGLPALRELWEHSLGCAAVAARLANGAGNAAPHLAFVAGLLHDLGRVLLLRHSSQRLADAARLATEQGVALLEAESRVLGIDHAELGAQWAEKANLPAAVVQCLRYHHEPPQTMECPAEAGVRALATIVQLADALCETYAIGKSGEPLAPHAALRGNAELAASDWAEVAGALKRRIEAARDKLGFVVRFEAEPPPFLRGPAFRAGGRAQVIPFPQKAGPAVVAPESAPAKKLTILVVEDHGSLCDMLGLFFMRHSYHVRTASNGEEAIDILAKEEIGLVLLDLMLPRVDGFAVLKWMREKRPTGAAPYVIVVSAGASEKDRSKVLELGANEYMPKPFHLTRLLERVQAVEKHLLGSPQTERPS
ncbi:MAG TPA: HDOD domain-containing protein [candidate division Zixibacteria bacterium]|nr:HDOD domain-containing protein [candidate division Zixibacteria bacterium]